MQFSLQEGRGEGIEAWRLKLGDGRLAMEDWRWKIGDGRLAMEDWRWKIVA